MPLAAGTRLGPYEILALAGAGGMGEVYRARDRRLGRDVALKVVGPALGSNPDIQRRFAQEGRFVAQLDHPRIAHIFDVGSDAGVDYLVMEFIEGDTLGRRLADGPLPLADLIGYAIEIAAGLAYAHAHGVVHRDLKPGNILLTQSGVKIIDFGLGKVLQPRTAPQGTLATNTKPMSPMTEGGLLTGTVQYMPPERLNGRDADQRSDVFAFGAVVYEMITGRRAFDGPSPADVIAAVLTSEPAPIGATSGALVELEWVVRRCLKKHPVDRWQSMADVEAILKRIAVLGPRRDAVPSAKPQLRQRLVVAAALGVVALAAVATLTRLGDAKGAATPRLVALSISPPAGGGFTPTSGSVQSPQLAVSPDGSSIAFVAAGADGEPELWIRPIDSTDAHPLAGTAGAAYPFWAATSRSLGFFADRQLKLVDIDGTPPRAIADASGGRGGAWNASGAVLFAANTAGPIYRIAADGSAEPATKLSAERGETSHRWPQWLPDGRHFLYFARSKDETQSGVYFGSQDGTAPSLVVHTNYGGVYAPPGQLLYVEDDTLMTTAFDLSTGRVRGNPIRVADRVATSSNFYGAFSASENGVVAYATSALAAELRWMGRDGSRLGLVAPRGEYTDFRLSPDGRYVAVAEVERHSGRTDLHLVDMVRGGNVRLTTSPATDASPVWSPDGSRIAFRSNRAGVHDLYVRAANGGGDDQLLLKTSSAKYPSDWSASGGVIVYHADDPKTHFDIWAAPVGGGAPRPLLRTAFDEMQAQLSPDGRWLAYTSTQSSRLEVYVEAVGSDSGRWQVSVGGGSDARWRRDGKELFYVANDGRLMAVTVNASQTFDAGTPRPLFQLPPLPVVAPYLNAYDVDAAGQRFLVRIPLESLETLPLTVLVNWSPTARATH